MRNPLVPVVLLLIVVILLCELPFGWVSRCFAPERSPQHYSHYVSEQNWMRIRVAETPSQHQRTVHLVAEVMEIADSNGTPHDCHGKLLVYLMKDSLLTSVPDYGDELLLLASPRLPSADDNPHQFNYRRHLHNKGISHTTFASPSAIRLLQHDSHGLMSAVSTLRQRLVQVIRLSSLTPAQQGIAEALFLGWDDDLAPETQSQFRQAGITHLLCVSGLHVGIVALLVGYLLSFIGNHRRGRIVKGCVTLLVIWFFVLLTGMAPGTMRAGLMFSFITVGRMAFSRPPTLNALAASALVLLVANPLLLFDVGFQLSYAAVLGIVLLMPGFQSLLPAITSDEGWRRQTQLLLHKVASLFFVSLSAQLATTPFILFYFHQFPVYFLIANMVVVPFAGLLLGSVILMVALAWWPAVFALLGGVVSAEIAATEWVTSLVARLPHALIQDIWFDPWMFVLTLAMTLLVGFALVRRSWRLLSAALAAAVVLAAYARVVESRFAAQSHFDVYRLGNRTAVEFFAGHQSYLLCDSTVAAHPEAINYQTSGNRRYRQAHATTVLPLDTLFSDDRLMVADRWVSFDGRTFRIVDRSNCRHHSMARPHVDYLLLRESPYLTVGELQQQYDFDTLLIASQNSQRRRSAWRAQCDSLDVPYIDCR